MIYSTLFADKKPADKIVLYFIAICFIRLVVFLSITPYAFTGINP